jgi:signal transduction histidine kinase
MATTISAKLFWHEAGYTGELILPPLWFLFALQHHGRHLHLPVRRKLLVFILPALGIALAFTNELHRGVWIASTLIASEQGSLLVSTYGPVFWVNAVYAYALMLAGSVMLGRGVLRSPKVFRNQTMMLLGAAVFPWLANVLFIAGLTPFSGFDLTPPSFAISGILITSAIFRYRLLDLKPVAYDVLFASMENEALVLDEFNRLLDANPAARRLFGLNEAHIGKPVETWLRPFPEFTCLFQDAGEAQCELAFEHHQAQVWRSMQTTSLVNAQGESRGKLIVLNDITQRKLAEAQMNLAHQKALEASRMKTRLLANISHDLRSPMTAVLGFSDLLRSGVLGEINEQQRIALENIQESANQQLDFVNNLIGQAQLETGQIILNIQHFSVEDLIESIHSTVKAVAARKGIELNFFQEASLPGLLYGDPYWIRQIMLNLVNNAIKFTAKGSVNVRVFQASADTWSLQVSDSGIGIPADKLDVIFEPFRQLKEGRANQSGSGLGLSIVKQLTDLMRGSIEVMSMPGMGSTFTVILPYQPETSLPSELPGASFSASALQKQAAF